MPRIPHDVMERVLAAHDIVEVVRRSLPLQPQGRVWVADCPFHPEKTRSFVVRSDRQSFKCLGCGKGGNVFGWLMERDGLTLLDAVRRMAAEGGVPLPETDGSNGAAPGSHDPTA